MSDRCGVTNSPDRIKEIAERLHGTTLNTIERILREELKELLHLLKRYAANDHAGAASPETEDHAYIRSIGFEPCEFGCGGWVHPNPSDPTAVQARKNHLCVPRLRKLIDAFDAAVPAQPPALNPGGEPTPELREKARELAKAIIDGTTGTLEDELFAFASRIGERQQDVNAKLIEELRIVRDKLQSAEQAAAQARKDAEACRVKNVSLVEECYRWRGKAAEAAAAQARKERDELQDWKDSAIRVSPPLQEIGRELCVGLGQSIHDKILPGIRKLKNEAAEARSAAFRECAEIARKFEHVSGSFQENKWIRDEIATAIEKAGGEK